MFSPKTQIQFADTAITLLSEVPEISADFYRYFRAFRTPSPQENSHRIEVTHSEGRYLLRARSRT